MENKKLALPHTLLVENRNAMHVSGVSDVDSFDEETVVLITELGDLIIKGVGLHINKIDVEAGDLSLTGEIYNISYTDSAPAAGGFFGRLFK